MDIPRMIGIGVVMIIPAFVGAGVVWAILHSWLAVLIWVVIMAGVLGKLLKDRFMNA